MGNNRIDFNKPHIMFREWKEYFPDKIVIDDDEWDDEPHGVIVQAVPPFHGSLPDVNKLFKFYVCSTDFRITAPMFESLDKDVDGIETLDKISPYKLRIGIGELFDEHKVQREITMVLEQWLNKQKSMDSSSPTD